MSGDPLPRTRLKPWRWLRAAIGAVAIVSLGGNPFDPGNVPRCILGTLAILLSFGLLLRLERVIQDKRDEAERPPEP